MGDHDKMTVQQKADLLLSICIPTHNRGSFLKETLESITPQYNDSIEIVILDSASTDNTRDVALEYHTKFPGINYCYKDEKMGIDVDMAKTVELAKGEYCWLMSSDDAITPNAIEILFEEIKHKYELFLCNRIVCDASLNPIKNRSWLTKKIKKSVFNLYEREELLHYLHSAIEFGSIFSYMSAIVFKRKEWNRIDYDKTFTGTGYAHVIRIFEIINNHGRLKYIETPLVLNRSFNDSFMEKGVVNRFMIDIDGYLLLASKLFSNDELVKKEFLKVMTLEHPWYQIVKLRAFIDDNKYWKTIIQRLLYCGFSNALLNICGMLGRMRKLVKLAVRLKYVYNTCYFHKNIYSLRMCARGFVKK
jgi:abequosyltransferase